MRPSHLTTALTALKAVGFTALELKQNGFGVAELKAGGYPLRDVHQAKFSLREILDGGYPREVAGARSPACDQSPHTSL
jgi:hypothetical protein